MSGAVIIVIGLLVVIPVGVIIAGAAAVPVIGWSLKTDAESRYEDSELLETNV